MFRASYRSPICIFVLILLAQFTFGQSGSPGVPLDSWVYPAIDRLTTLGFVEAPFFGERPWTRRECAILARGARIALEQQPSLSDTSVRELVAELNREFAADIAALDTASKASLAAPDTSLKTVQLESVYARSLYISGAPLRDGYHFGQTIANDFGRPYEQGMQAIAGASAYGVRGRFFFYASGEYQRTPSFAGLPPETASAIATIDNNPNPPNAGPHPTLNNVRLLDTYVGVKLSHWQATFGKQSLWWGTGNSGPMLFSDNVEPPPMFRLTNVDPVRLPGFLRFLGETRFDMFVGKLSGHTSPAEPYIHGEKISLKPIKNLEVDFSRSTVFLGAGRDASLSRILSSYFSVSSTSANVLAANDPGDRHGGLTVSYQFPKRPLTLYLDSFTDDDPSPLSPSKHVPFGAFRRAPLNPGFYLARLPYAKRLDLRAEGFYTDVPSPRSTLGRFNYWNVTYPDSYTQKGFILGNTIGREGKGGQVWTTYWFSPRSTLQLSYRGAKVAHDFIPGGGTQNTFYAKTNLLLFKKLELTAQVHAERWAFPMLAATPQHDFGGLLMLRLWGNDLKR